MEAREKKKKDRISGTCCRRRLSQIKTESARKGSRRTQPGVFICIQLLAKICLPTQYESEGRTVRWWGHVVWISEIIVDLFTEDFTACDEHDNDKYANRWIH